uniref:GmrSD restriction endonucleases N-terminal domain-containing protein n=1 Tax=Mycena chlorophos TaxID=658473 RepID=A0ABQ0LGY3_MYCCL|nr:predicted protein [Mycena chlorophos]
MDVDDDCRSEGSYEPGDSVDTFMGRKFPESKQEFCTTEKLNELLNSGRINLNAKYQRNVVWNEKGQSALVDSLLRNAPVSQLVFAKYIEDGLEKYMCVDGKQRLTTIHKFIKGEIPFENAADGKKYWFDKNDQRPAKSKAYVPEASKKDFLSKRIPCRPAKSKVYVPEASKKDFLSKRIPCVFYSGLLPTQENDIFARLQRGAPLTTAEKLLVHDTPRANVAREFLDNFLDNPSSPLCKGSPQFTLRRGRDRSTAYRYLVTILHTLTENKMVHFGGPASDRWLASEEEVKPALKAGLVTTMQVYEAIANCSDALKNRVAPAEFHATVVLVHRYRDKATLSALAEAIQGLKDDIREKHPREVKSTTKVYADMQAYMTRWAAGTGNKLKAGDLSATKQVQLSRLGAAKTATASIGGGVGAEQAAVVSTPVTGTKRKRQPVVEKDVPTPTRSSPRKKPKSVAPAAAPVESRTPAKRVVVVRTQPQVAEAAPSSGLFFNFQAAPKPRARKPAQLPLPKPVLPPRPTHSESVTAVASDSDDELKIGGPSFKFESPIKKEEAAPALFTADF